MKHRPRKASRRWLAIAAVAALVAAMLVVFGWMFWPRDPYAMPRADWRLFKKKFLVEGRIVDDGNGGITHSEGQGYGMLLAVAYRDRTAFDSIWKWTRDNLKQKNDFLFSWKWEPGEDGAAGRVGDANNATDGDLLIAWALLRAHREWNDYKYFQAAGQIIATLLPKATADTWLGTQFLPGAIGFNKPDGIVVNPSYIVFPAITELAVAFPSEKWRQLRAGGIALIQTARFGKWSLAPDWTLVADHWVALAPDHDPVFGYNAIRVPLHIAWDDPASPLLGEFADFWESPPAAKWDPAVVNLETASFGPYAALPGMVAVRDLTLACAKNNTLTVAQIPPISTEESYYSASLKLLTKLAIRERFAPKRN